LKPPRLTARARRDVHCILAHIAQDNPDAARRVAAALADKFAFLARNPGAGRIRPDVREGYRSFPVYEYLIFYRILPPGVQIMRVIHGRRDLEQLIN
jgi:toxin ParE1/3/4